MRTLLFVIGGLAAAAFLFIYFPFRPWISDDYGPDDSDDPGEDVDGPPSAEPTATRRDRDWAASLIEVPGSRVVDDTGRTVSVTYATPENIAARAAATPEERAELDALERSITTDVLATLASTDKVPFNA